MSEDWKQIAIDSVNQCQAYEEEIKNLESSLMLKKKASFADPVLLKEAVQALVKTGSLAKEQADESLRLMGEDPNAALRVITALCKSADAKPLIKTESANLAGGELVSDKGPALNERDRAYQAAAKAMGLALN